MARDRRIDYPGAWLHVMVRALAQRPMFECVRDIRHFLACVAKSVRRREIEVHCYVVLTTHAHLLVRSPAGRVSDAMRRVMSEYVRDFNRRIRRSGPLVRSRFNSKHVAGDGYWSNVVSYIDRNPVAAGLVANAVEYPYGSRRRYASMKGPPWLTRSRVEAEVREVTGGACYQPAGYDKRFLREGGRTAAVIERLVIRGDRSADSRFDVLGAGRPELRAWLLRNARLADGRRLGTPLADAGRIHALVRDAAAADPAWRVAGRGGWAVLLAGLLRSLTGEAQASLAQRMGVTRWVFRALCESHNAALRTDESYGARFEAVGAGALRGEEKEAG